ncbi:UDP-glucose dehydrogenase family protein [Paenibacillus kobensis]|uniref:UDP-glucose dehydrogenase family protein n=1 Tax=Paenibacillus kobensis TaxID=59841 RepID=UPI001C3FBFBD|nr:UDP-glucose/GDP-mannose dehydrogenase family protein [Paenibacillus kobensis]
MITIGIIGTGYVGLVHGAVLAHYGFQVTCMDVDDYKITRLREGESPIYEPGLDKLLKEGLQSGALSFTTSAEQVVHNSDVIFIAVGTPSKMDGSADLRYVREAALSIAQYADRDKLVVLKSTLPVGTCGTFQRYFDSAVAGSGAAYRIEVASNPEFLRQGQAVSDALSPSRVIIGTESEHAERLLQSVYSVHADAGIPFLCTNLESAEMIKYAANSFLAVKISFINEMALLAEKVGANISHIAQGMGMDERISPHFLQAGPGYGGSCFPKDTQALVDVGRRSGEELYVVQAAIAANKKQKQTMLDRISETLSYGGSLKGRTIAVWGLAFKPDTDDIRETPSYDVIQGLSGKGAAIRVYCPQGMKQAVRLWPDLNPSIEYCISEEESAIQADAIVIMTEWEQFRRVDWNAIAGSMRSSFLFDCRNMFGQDKAVRGRFHYYGVGDGSDRRHYTLREAQ